MADYVLNAKITGDSSGFTKAFQSANHALEELSAKTKAVGAKVQDFGKGMADIGKGMTARFSAPIVGGITYAVKSFADLEQAVGGIETLFKNSAQTVIKNSDTAFKRAGVSSTSYMEQVTSFSATLLQGLKGNTAEAAKYADMAIVDMSDNANKMGTNIGMIQDAYQGFAKDNYTMLDNLKLGYGGTASEMARLVNDSGVMGKSFKATAENVNDIPFDQLVLAIHKTQQEMDITGTTAIEASSTVSGSFGSMVAAGQNLAAGLGNPTADVQGLIADLQSTVMAFAGNVKRVLGTIWNNLPLAEWQKWAIVVVASIGPILVILGVLTQGIGMLVTAIGFIVSPIGLVVAAIAALAAAFSYFMLTNEKFRSSVLSAFSQIGQVVSSVIQSIQPILQGLWTAAQPIIANIGSQLSAAFQSIGAVINTILPIFTTFFSSLVDGFNSAGGVGSGFVINLVTILLGLSPVIKFVITLFQTFGTQIVASFQQIVAIVLPVVGTLGTALGEIAGAVIPVLMQAFATLIPVIVQAGMSFTSIVKSVLPVLISLFNQLVPIITQVVMILADVIAQVIPLVAVLLSSLMPVIVNVISVVMNIVQTVAPAVIAIVQLIIAVIRALMPVIMLVLTIVVEVIAGIISTLSPIVAFIGHIIVAIMAIISPIIAFVAGVITAIISVITPVIAVVSGVFSTVFSIVSGVFRGIMTFIGAAINSISGIIGGLSSVVSGVFNTIFGTISRTMGKVSSKITGVFAAIKSAWSGLTGFVSGVFSGISGAVSSLIGRVKNSVNSVIGGINGAISLINKIPGVHMGRISYLAHGTDDWQGGFAVMNEGGRGELVNLPDGSQVIPHDVSMRYAREAAQSSSTSDSGGKTESSEPVARPIELNIENYNDYTGKGPKQIAQELAFYMREEKAF